MPVAQRRRQIPPWTTRAIQIKDGFDKLAITLIRRRSRRGMLGRRDCRLQRLPNTIADQFSHFDGFHPILGSGRRSSCRSNNSWTQPSRAFAREKSPSARGGKTLGASELQDGLTATRKRVSALEIENWGLGIGHCKLARPARWRSNFQFTICNGPFAIPPSAESSAALRMTRDLERVAHRLSD